MQKSWWVPGFAVLGVIFAVGLLVMVTGPPRGGAVLLLPLPTPLPLVVHMAGAVAQPGVYTLPAGSRVADGVAAAGGLSAGAAQGAVNLAAYLEDGARIFIPLQTPTPIPGFEMAIPAGDRSGDVPWSSASLINITPATLAELESLPEIGTVKAQAILAYREAHGPFLRIEDIQDVDGIGPTIFEQIKDLITVGDTP